MATEVPPNETKEDRKARKAAMKQAIDQRGNASTTSSATPAAPAASKPDNAEVKETKEEKKARKAAKKLAEEQATGASRDGTLANQGEEKTHSETKEERKARRKAEKLAKAGHSDVKSVEISIPEAGPSTLPPPSENQAANVEAESSSGKKAKKDKKRKRLEEVPADAVASQSSAAPVDAADGQDSKKSKKDKKKERRDKQAEVGAAGTEVSRGKAYSPSVPVQALPESVPATGVFADPQLSDAAKRALHYVHLHALSHSKSSAAATEPAEPWKFNKAKQIWLMKHVWNESDIPESYFEGVVAYFKTLQASSRRNFIDDAKKMAKAPEPAVDSATPAAEGENELAADASIEEVTAEADGKTATEADSEVPAEDAEAASRRQRAQRLLKALGAR